MEEVTGSIPVGSTNTKPIHPVFRSKAYGWAMPYATSDIVAGAIIVSLIALELLFIAARPAHAFLG